MNNRYLDLSKKKKNIKRRKSNKNKPIILLSLLALRQVKLSYNKIDKAKLYKVWDKKLLAKKNLKYKKILMSGLIKL